MLSRQNVSTDAIFTLRFFSLLPLRCRRYAFTYTRKCYAYYARLRRDTQCMPLMPLLLRHVDAAAITFDDTPCCRHC